MRYLSRRALYFLSIFLSPALDNHSENAEAYDLGKRRWWFIIGIIVLAYGLTIFHVLSGRYDLFLAFLTISLVASAWLATPPPTRRMLFPWISVGCAIGAVFSFAVAISQYRLANAVVENVIKMKAGENFEGKILRFGERIVLVFEPASKKLLVFKWEQIDSIENKTR